MTTLRPMAMTLPLIGWKEDLRLPSLSPHIFTGKIDTGARSSALHADDIRISGKHVSFRFGTKRHKMKLADTKRIKSSNGHSEVRPVIETEVEVGRLCFVTQITLTNRTDMDHAMLLGREAIKGRFLVHAGRTFLLKLKGAR